MVPMFALTKGRFAPGRMEHLERGPGGKRPGSRSSHAIDTVDSVLRENSRGQKFEGSAKTPPDRDGNGGGEEWRELWGVTLAEGMIRTPLGRANRNLYAPGGV